MSQRSAVQRLPLREQHRMAPLKLRDGPEPKVRVLTTTKEKNHDWRVPSTIQFKFIFTIHSLLAHLLLQHLLSVSHVPTCHSQCRGYVGKQGRQGPCITGAQHRVWESVSKQNVHWCTHRHTHTVGQLVPSSVRIERAAGWWGSGVGLLLF